MNSNKMFDIRIMTSAKMLKMPIHTQYLYYKLMLNTDNNGIVVCDKNNIIKNNRDSLNLLIKKDLINLIDTTEKKYIIKISDWLSHKNNIEEV